MADPVGIGVEAVYRAYWPTLVASLARWTGDLDRAEDAAAEAVAAACENWPRDGIPAEPAAWLQTAARRRVLDRIRRDHVARAKLVDLAHRLEDSPAADAISDPDDPFGAVRWSDAAAEDLLRLVFTCCHPALAPSAQVPLALRLLCGLTAAEAARLLVTTESTVAQRIVRAKRKIRDAGIAMTVPPRDDWPGRLDAVLAVVGLVFTEGHAATHGPALVRTPLCDEALRLAALLRRLLPDEAEVLGLSALLLITDARRDARLDGGQLVRFDDQDRTAWRWPDIDRGLVLAATAVQRAGARPGRWVLQSSIAALQVHPVPDREAVLALFDRLAAINGSPATLVNRAAAVAKARGAQAGLLALDEIRPAPGDHRAALLRAELHHQLGEYDVARSHLTSAIDAAQNDVERRHLEARLTDWSRT
ncbi:MAG: DUF6596 domain-containing protein [Mycobacteriales bacterium]